MGGDESSYRFQDQSKQKIRGLHTVPTAKCGGRTTYISPGTADGIQTGQGPADAVGWGTGVSAVERTWQKAVWSSQGFSFTPVFSQVHSVFRPAVSQP